MSADGSAAERDVVRKLARGSLLSRLKALAPAAEARRRAARPCPRRPPARRSAARRPLQRRQRDARRSPTSISPRSARAAPLAEQLQGFSWLRDLAAAASREKGARLAEAIVGRWLLAHGTTRRRRLGAASVGRAHPLLDGLRALHPVEQRQRLSLGPAQHARARRAAPRRQRRQGAAGLDADHRLVRRGRGRAAGPGRRSARRARRGGAGARAGRRAVRRWRADQPLARSSRCCWSTASACCAPAISPPSRPSPTASKPPPRPRSPRFMASPWATARCRAGRAAIPAKPARLTALDRRLRLARPPAAPARAAGAISGCRRSARSSCSMPRRRRRRRWPRRARASTLAFELSRRRRSGWSSIAAGPGPLPTDSAGRAGRGAAHDRRAQHAGPRRHQFDQHPRRRLARQGRRGRRHRPQRGQ